jgi:hypothetical protein
MPDFFVSLERAISQMAYTKDVSAPIFSATEHPTESAGRIGTDQEGQSQSSSRARLCRATEACASNDASAVS